MTDRLRFATVEDVKMIARRAVIEELDRRAEEQFERALAADKSPPGEPPRPHDDDTLPVTPTQLLMLAQALEDLAAKNLKTTHYRSLVSVYRAVISRIWALGLTYDTSPNLIMGEPVDG